MEAVLFARVLLFLIALAGFASRARALELHVEPGATCVTASSLRMQIDAWLGGATITAGSVVEVRGSATNPREIGYQLREGTRLIASREFAPGPSACAQLEASLALAIALALKASLLEELQPTRARSRFAIGAAGIVLFGFTPRTPFGVQGTFDASISEHLWVRAGLAFWAAGNNALPLGQGRFDLRALAFRGELCGSPFTHARWSVFGCAGTRIGGLWAQGERLPTDTKVRDPWVALSAGFGASLQLSPRWSIDLYAGMVASLARSRFELRTREGARVDAYSISTLSSELNLGPRLLF